MKLTIEQMRELLETGNVSDLPPGTIVTLYNDAGEIVGKRMIGKPDQIASEDEALDLIMGIARQIGSDMGLDLDLSIEDEDGNIVRHEGPKEVNP